MSNVISLVAARKSRQVQQEVTHTIRLAIALTAGYSEEARPKVLEAIIANSRYRQEVQKALKEVGMAVDSAGV